MLTRNTNSRPSDIPVQKAEERKRNSGEECTGSRQLASEQKRTDEQESEAIN